MEKKLESPAQLQNERDMDVRQTEVDAQTEGARQGGGGAEGITRRAMAR